MSTQHYNHHWPPQYLEPEHRQTARLLELDTNLTLFVAKPNVIHTYNCKEKATLYTFHNG